MMVVMASKYRIELSEAEERELRRRAGQYYRSHRAVLRAKIVLLLGRLDQRRRAQRVAAEARRKQRALVHQRLHAGHRRRRS
jgi:hypothetical protein